MDHIRQRVAELLRNALGFFPKLTDLSGRGKSVEPKKTREKTSFAFRGLIDTLGNYKFPIGKTAS